MRLFHSAALAAAAMMLASVASAQGLGDAAAREREKKDKAPAARPARVFTESDLGPSTAAPKEPELPLAAPAPTGAAGQTAAPGSAVGDSKAKPGEKTEEEKAAELKAKEEAAWRDELDQVRKAEQATRQAIEDVQLQLNDTSSMYTAGRARALASLEQGKQKLAELQARIGTLEAEGRGKGYR